MLKHVIEWAQNERANRLARGFGLTVLFALLAAGFFLAYCSQHEVWSHRLNMFFNQ